LKKNLFPFSLDENIKKAKNIVNNISTWIFQLENKNNQKSDELALFLSTLQESQIILGYLYDIKVI
jgi:hypothetical protein